MDYQNISSLSTIPAYDKNTAAQLLTKELADLDIKIIVLDDDPTGIQTVHDVSVYTDWSDQTLLTAFKEEAPLFFILTNSRSFSAKKTEQVHTDIAAAIAKTAALLDQDFLLLSRGDSTLRGHYPLETAVLKDTLTKHLTISFDGEIICPFFPEGGRYTIDNIHYVREGDQLTPAGNTEFAKDKTFPYTASDLRDYVEEKSDHAYKRDDCICISLEELNSCAYAVITKKLMAAKHFTKIIVNAVSYEQLRVFVVSLLRAIKSNKHFIARCAAALPKVIGNISDQPLLTKTDIISKTNTNGGLIIIGSHVKKTTTQFEALKNADLPLSFLEFDVNTYFENEGFDHEVTRVRTAAEAMIRQGKTVVIYTSRKLLAPSDYGPEALLSLSVSISEALTSIVSNLSLLPGFIIAKGGITSSDIGTKGLAVKKAFVLGQIAPGIPVWKTGPESKFPDISYIIFPGNVGTDTTLLEIVQTLTL